ncbi:hypothetical protein GE061_018542 [Apolygus lucorum]|uniref:DDE Tnp4 domain-containing protein n=1 Tax=Apolygus lucorum TaxID=248454 RepID=A0A8S9XG79_APOLU|nr:hypothetical protein GE061_018542 [Apolygus lucorum]
MGTALPQKVGHEWNNSWSVGQLETPKEGIRRGKEKRGRLLTGGGECVPDLPTDPELDNLGVNIEITDAVDSDSVPDISYEVCRQMGTAPPQKVVHEWNNSWRKMVRHYQRKKPPPSYSQEDMEKARSAIKNHALSQYLAKLTKTGRFSKTVHHFPEPGHGFMPCDRAFGIIEQNMGKKDRIFLPEEYARFEANAFDNHLLVADSGYANTSYLVTPPLQVTTRAEELFNESLIRTRNPVERPYGVWKRRFPVLTLGLRLTLEATQAAIIATAVLHNIASGRNTTHPPQDPDQPSKK